MNLDEKLRKRQYDLIWQEYCGFLDLKLPQYMDIQKRLLLEQLKLYGKSELGRHIMKEKKPEGMEEFRQLVPLTAYEDYADLLLNKVESALPAKPIIWIQTTWEGAQNPIKVAPYTEGMVKNYSNCIMAAMVLMTSSSRGTFSLRGGENFLNGMAPLPYLTGLIPHLVSSNITVNFMPPTAEAVSMRFRERTKAGFQMGMQRGLDLFFGMSSIVARMGSTFASGSGSSDGINLFKNSPKMNSRLLKAWINSKQEGTSIKPKDIWDLKGLAITGTDTASLKPQIEETWGLRPLELFGGTEATCVAVESWKKDGLVFFPEVAFYEFIPKTEIEKNIENPLYQPRTYLMNELLASHEYELVITSFKGGAFARYRTGDMFRCNSLSDKAEGIMLPHFTYLDRYPTIVDIAGFTRISERTIVQAINLSRLDIDDWFAVKDVTEDNKTFLHMYVEIGEEGMRSGLNRDIVSEHLAIYFRHIDSDFGDLKTMLGIDPLKITVMPRGTMGAFLDLFSRPIRRMNPSHFDLVEITKMAGDAARRDVS